MPIAVEAVPKADFAKWLGKAKVKFKAEKTLKALGRTWNWLVSRPAWQVANKGLNSVIDE